MYVCIVHLLLCIMHLLVIKYVKVQQNTTPTQWSRVVETLDLSHDFVLQITFRSYSYCGPVTPYETLLWPIGANCPTHKYTRDPRRCSEYRVNGSGHSLIFFYRQMELIKACLDEIALSGLEGQFRELF